MRSRRRNVNVMANERDDDNTACAKGATCALGGDVHCRTVTRYPWLLEDVSSNECCVKGCFLDEKKDGASG